MASGGTAGRAAYAAEEQLILVDEDNRAIGSAGKIAVHRSNLLHRAFSIFIVDQRGRIVLQRRNPKKYHSGGLWAIPAVDIRVQASAPSRRRGGGLRKSWG